MSMCIIRSFLRLVIIFVGMLLIENHFDEEKYYTFLSFKTAMQRLKIMSTLFFPNLNFLTKCTNMNEFNVQIQF